MITEIKKLLEIYKNYGKINNITELKIEGVIIKANTKKIQNWLDKFKLLLKYYKENGNIDIPLYYEFNGIRLGQWLKTQRIAYECKGNVKISKEQIKKLNELNHDWSPTDTKRLNKDITDSNKEKYYEILEKRINHILDDLIYEEINEITTLESQKEIENIVIKRLFR